MEQQSNASLKNAQNTITSYVLLLNSGTLLTPNNFSVSNVLMLKTNQFLHLTHKEN